MRVAFLSLGAFADPKIALWCFRLHDGVLAKHSFLWDMQNAG